MNYQRLNRFTIDILFVSLTLAFSLFFSKLYTEGDQKLYHNYYSNVKVLNIVQGYSFFKAKLRTSEPGYFLFTFIFSRIIEKNILFSIVNSIIAYKILVLFRIYRVSFKNKILLFLNFYLLMLFFSADRLKLSILFFIMAMSKIPLKSCIFTVLSLLTHVQSIVIIAAKVIYSEILNFVQSFRTLKIKIKSVSLIILIFVLIIILFFLSDHIISKLLFYLYYNKSFASMLKPLFFTILSYIQFNDRKFFLINAPLIISSYFVGEERLVIFSFFIYIYFAIINKKLNKPITQILLTYFVLKGFLYLISIYSFGHGYVDLIDKLFS